MASLNKCMFIGNVGQDPELRQMPNGTAVTQISLGVSDRWKDKNTGATKEHTEWVKVVAFGQLAEYAGKYCTKGSLLYVEGGQKTRSYEKDGVTHYITEIRAAKIEGLKRPEQSQHSQAAQEAQNYEKDYTPPQQAQPAEQQKPAPAPPADMDFDDIPFS